MTIFYSDLETFLKNQKVCLTHFTIVTSGSDITSYPEKIDLDSTIDRICGCLEKPRVQKLKVKRLVFISTKLSQLIRLLSFLELKCLETALVSPEISDQNMGMRKLLELEEFKNAAPLNLEVLKGAITLEDLIVVKEKMSKSKTIRQLQLLFEEIDKDGLNHLFGEPVSDDKYHLFGESSVPIPKSHGDELISNLNLVYKDSKYAIDIYRRRFFEKTKYLDKNGVFLDDEDLSEMLNSLLSETNSSCLVVFGNPLILAKIVEHLAFFEIQSLQCASTLLHDTMATVKPNPKIDGIQIELQNVGPILLGVNVDKPLHRHVVYLEKEIDHECERRIITPDTQSKCLEDLARILKFQNTPLKKFKLFFSSHLAIKRPPGFYHEKSVSLDNLLTRFGKFVEMLAIFLATRDQKLKVECLDMVVLTEDNTVKIIKNLEPGTLKKIQMKPCEFIHRVRLNIDKLCELEQWNQAEEFCTRWVMIPSSFEGFTHFAKADVGVEEITEENLFNLKEKLLESPKLIKYDILFKSTTIDVSNFDLLGPPYISPNDPMADSRKVWYYRYSESDDVLLVLFFIEKQRVVLSRVGIGSVPDDAFLL